MRGIILGVSIIMLAACDPVMTVVTAIDAFERELTLDTRPADGAAEQLEIVALVTIDADGAISVGGLEPSTLETIIDDMTRIYGEDRSLKVHLRIASETSVADMQSVLVILNAAGYSQTRLVTVPPAPKD